MLAPLTYQPQLQVKVAPISASNGLSRVFAAAVVNHQFRKLLLDDPQTALRTGYLGETFKLNEEERDLIVSIHAETLADLARQVNKALGGSH
jgi:hypothetical protein